MSHQSYRSPRLTSIFGGILVVLLLIIAVCMLGSVVKLVGFAGLFVPSQLGVLTQARGADVARLDMQRPFSVLAFARPGKYHVYTSDLDLLSAAALLERSDATPWLTIRPARTGEEVPVRFVGRGVRPYDSLYAPGRPILSFSIPAPGEYVLTHPARQALLAVVPDYTTGQEARLGLLALTEALLVAGIVVLLFQWRARRRRAARGRAG